MTDTPPAPAPWSYAKSGSMGGSGDFNLYITDKDGRKIAAVWGKRGEKERTAALMIAAPDILAAAKSAMTYWQDNYPTIPEPMQKLFDAIALTELSK